MNLIVQCLHFFRNDTYDLKISKLNLLLTVGVNYIVANTSARKCMIPLSTLTRGRSFEVILKNEILYVTNHSLQK